MNDLRQEICDLKPIVHCITNEVSMNDCANVLLAIGASPIMAHHPEEVAEITERANALVCNFGAMLDYDAMRNAAKVAKELGHPIVVDPVGVAGSSFRRERCLSFMKEFSPSCIRGNRAEVLALIQNTTTGAGLDGMQTKEAGEISKEDLISLMQNFSRENKVILVVSGVEDIITDGEKTICLECGDQMMSRVTGTGCMSTVILGAYLSVENSIRGVEAACLRMGMAGEQAGKTTREKKGGTMTFRQLLIDELSK